MPSARPTRALAALAAATLLGGSTLGAQTPTHAYSLNGSYDDALGGPALVGLGGTLGANGYTFGPNQGLSLSNALGQSVYSIELAFSFTATGGYRKIIDFKARAADAGLYNYSTHAYVYPHSGVGIGPAGAFADGVQRHLVVTRDAGNVFTAYVNGVQQFAADLGTTTTFSAANQIAYFLMDDGATASEASGGYLDYLRTYDVALTAAQVEDRFEAGDTPITATPEPASIALVATGLVAVVGVARRRRTR